jgi:uncharacterized repeat protein (TIGR03833 family)
MTLDGRYRINVKIGIVVRIEEKLNNNSSLISGIVKEIQTKTPYHKLGIRVLLENGVEGRVQEIPSDISNLDLSQKTPFELINLLETTLRDLIVKCLAIQENWWKLIPQDVREHAEQRAERDSKFQKTMRMNKHSEIDQIDFADLERIFIKRDFWKKYFRDIFLDEKILSAKLQEISIMRNHVDHSKSLSKDNEERLRIYCNDLFDLIRNSEKS